MPSRTFSATVVLEGSASYIPLPFDPKEVFGQVRAPVRVTLNGYTYRSTIAAMGGPPFIPLRKSNREAARLKGGETVEVYVELDAQPRLVEPPPDFLKALKANPPAWRAWGDLSYTHQREHVEAIEEAVQTDTRARRIEKAVATLAAMPSKG